MQQYIDQAGEAIKTIIEKLQTNENNAAYYAAGGAAALVGLSGLYAYATSLPRGKTFDEYQPVSETETPLYDVAIVGAGPSGSTLAFYLCRDNKDLKVLLLEKKQFPRDKYCGDAVASVAQKHLEEMGVLQEIVAEKKGHFSQNGGFVSPCGRLVIGNSAQELGLGTGAVVIAVKRIVLDEKIARAAQKQGALLTENTTVNDATWIPEKGIWKVDCTFQDEKPVTYYARLLVCADGAPSALATKLGYVKDPPQGTCSRAYVKGNTRFQYDGVVFYPKDLLPGYCAIIREAGNELNFCTYIIPGGPAKNEDLPKMHNDIMTNYPYVAKSLGPNPDIERMKSASLRLGGIKKSYDDHLLIIGDAAGFIDPLTGEGIQYAIAGSALASKVVLDAFKKKNLCARELKKYQNMWYKEWGRDFYWSMKMSLLLYRFPIMLDAAAKLVEKRGSKFLAQWAEVMTGTKSKTWFLRFDVWPFLLIEIGAQAYRNVFGSKN